MVAPLNGPPPQVFFPFDLVRDRGTTLKRSFCFLDLEEILITALRNQPSELPAGTSMDEFLREHHSRAFYRAWKEAEAKRREQREAARKAAREIGFACLLTTTTTAIGLLALIWTDLPTEFAYMPQGM